MSSIINHPPPEKTVKQNCCHYWRIEAIDGRTSKGVCKYCGEEMEFINPFEDMWDENKYNNKASYLLDMESDDLPV